MSLNVGSFKVEVFVDIIYGSDYELDHKIEYSSLLRNTSIINCKISKTLIL